ncbi:MAG TPA: biotin/lipoyl-containing protein, partial [Puia sp.]|nr:biotin/lipoyl-containing protein [Puia sp.]
MLVDLVMPKMGESIMEATILKWLKQPGDTVKQDETLLEIATDKVDTEVPSITAGTLEEILFQVNDVVPIGAVIARVRTNLASADNTLAPAGASGAVHNSQPAPVNHPAQPQYHAQPAAQYRPQPATNATNGAALAANRFYSPLVLNIAASEGVPLSELESIPGSGNEGRVTKKDILQYIAERKTGGPSTVGMTAIAHRPAPQPANTSLSLDHTSAPASYGGNVEIIEMDRMRRLIADHMVRSK